MKNTENFHKKKFKKQENEKTKPELGENNF